MKIIKLCLMALLPVLLSCSDSEELETKPNLIDSWTNSTTNQFKDATVLAGNFDNPYDLAGSIHTELFTDYCTSTAPDSSLTVVITDLVKLANANANFRNLSATSYSFTNTQRLERLLVVSDSVLTTSLRIAVSDVSLQMSFENFIKKIMTECGNEASYLALHNEIVSYEDTIMDDISVSASDKKVVLTVTSVLRYKIKRLKKRPKKNTDSDWDLMITTMGAAAEGGKEDLQEAIILSLLAEIYKKY